MNEARWLDFHQIGNGQRTHNSYELLTEIFRTKPPVPALNGEPYYAGMERPPWEKEMDSAGQDGAPGGTELSAQYCRSAMYGSVLSGGFGGHIYGAGGWDGGLWGGNVEPEAKTRLWDVMQWESGAQMRHLARFMLSEGRAYRDLVPDADLVQPNRSAPQREFVGWAYCARTDDRTLFLLYFEKDCPQATLFGVATRLPYEAAWFDPRTGEWTPAGTLKADTDGKIRLPKFPGGSAESEIDWALKLTLTIRP